jgi:hypothetical protein
MDLTVSPKQFLSDYAEKRIDYYNDRRILLTNGELIIPHKVVVRGMPSYRARVGKSFDDLHKYMTLRNMSAVHVRLSPRSVIGKSPLESLLDMDGIINSFLSFVQKVKGFRPYYVWCKEPTKRGHCHYHILFIGMNYLLPKNIVDDWFTNRGLGDHHGVFIEALREKNDEAASQVLGYLIKYVSKPSVDMCWAGLLALTRRREWGMSNNLREKMENYLLAVSSRKGTTNSNSPPTDPVKWECLGMITISLLDELMKYFTTVEAFKTDWGEINAAARSVMDHSHKGF